MKAIARLIVKMCGWKIKENYPEINKSVCIMAPHTSMLDFIWGKLYFMSLGIKPRFLIKSEMFTWYFAWLLKALGGVPVHRKAPVGLVGQLLGYFNSNNKFTLVITPEGTRKRVSKWKTGALRIANEANVPLVVGRMDYKKKEMGIVKVYNEIPRDLHFINTIKKDFEGIVPRHPEKVDLYYEQ